MSDSQSPQSNYKLAWVAVIHLCLLISLSPYRKTGRRTHACVHIFIQDTHPGQACALTHLMWLTLTDTHLHFATWSLPRNRIKRKAAAFHWGTGEEEESVLLTSHKHHRQLLLSHSFHFWGWKTFEIICIKKRKKKKELKRVVVISVHLPLTANRMRSGNRWNQITHKTNRLYASVLFPLWLCIHLLTYLSIGWWVRGPYKERCCLLEELG